MRWGIFLAVLGVACYIVHAVLLNHYLRKHVPEVLARDPGVPSQRPRQVYLVRGATPRWVTLLGLPALPLLLLRLVLIAISFLVTIRRSSCFGEYEFVTACVCETQTSQGLSHPKTRI
jgi:hypothetical protein